MATAHENSESVEAKQADAQQMESKHANSQLDHSGIVKPEKVDMEPMDEEVPDSQQADAQAASVLDDSLENGSELAHPQPLGEEDFYPEQVSAEHAPSETVSSEHEQSTVETVTASEPIGSENVGSDIAHPQPLGEEDLYHEQIDSDHVHTDHVHSEHVHSQEMDTDHVQSQQMDTQNVQSQPMDTENMHSQPMDSEHVHSHPMDSELVHSDPTSAELAHSEPDSAEMVHLHHVTTEMVQSHTVSGEMVHSHPVTGELVHQHPVTGEMDHSHLVTEEMVHSHSVMYSQPVNSDIVHSQPVTSEHMHMPQVSMEPVNLHPVGIELAHPHSLGGEHVNSHAVGMELVPSEQPITAELPNTPQDTPDTQPNKRRKKKSIVWEHFTIETVSAGCRRACCKVCKQSFAYSTGSKVAGTSHLKRHIAKGTCPVLLRQQEKSQLTPYMPKSGGTEASTEPPKRRYRGASSPYLLFDQDKCRHEIARMFIMHEYPLHMVEHPGFVSFVQNLQPRFDMVSFNIVQGDCVATFLREKQNLQRFIEGIPGRVCLTIDMWTSGQSTGYVFVTGQFIDNDWKLHRRLLNVVMEPFPESDTALSHAVGTCLSDWGLDRKLASITFNQPQSEAALGNLRALLAVKNPLLLNGQLLIRNCIARTLSSMAQEVITGGRETIRKIRSSVKYVKTSDTHEEKFFELKRQLQVPTEEALSLDNTTKWNTTYEMLRAASELKEVFTCLDTSDPEYKDAPSADDWKEVENICMYLKLLYDTANMLITKGTLSSNVFFHEVWKIQLELARAAASDDLFVAGLAKPLQDKFHKYWKNSCLMLAIAVAMDPRFKMKLVEFSFTKIFGEEAPVYIRVVDEGIHELFHEYVTLPLPLTPAYTEDGQLKSEDQQGPHLLTSNGLSDFDMYIMETTSQQMKSELDQYLEESLLPRLQDFDVLGWWMLNKIKYPMLSKMARDILSLPLSTVPAESVFDTAPKEMDAYRCSLRPETVEALICAKDWLQPESSKGSREVVKMEQL